MSDLHIRRIVIGDPASGRTTYAKDIISRFPETKFDLFDDVYSSQHNKIFLEGTGPNGKDKELDLKVLTDSKNWFLITQTILPRCVMVLATDVTICVRLGEQFESLNPLTITRKRINELKSSYLF